MRPNFWSLRLLPNTKFYCHAHSRGPPRVDGGNAGANRGRSGRSERQRWHNQSHATETCQPLIGHAALREFWRRVASRGDQVLQRQLKLRMAIRLFARAELDYSDCRTATAPSAKVGSLDRS